MNDQPTHTNPEDARAQLDAAWSTIEEAIRAVGEQVRNDPLNEDPLRRQEAYQATLASIAESYVNQVRYDRKRPEASPTFGSLFNFAAPAPDFAYHLLHLQPRSSYRVWGQRGDAQLIDVQQLAGWFGQGRTATLANELFDSKGIELDSDGRFDFVLGPAPRQGQWWKLHERVTTVFIREYFTDYATQGRASVFHFDKLEADLGTTVAGTQEVVEKLQCFAQAVRTYGGFLSMPQTFSKVGNNHFQEIHFGDISMSDQRYFQARFEVRPGEALIGEWRVPDEYLYWSIALNSDAYQMLNYGNRQVNLNQALAKVGPDRIFHFVLSHEDPGIANWLDLDGHELGIVLMRSKGASAFELPSLRRIDAWALDQHLPADIVRTTAEQRQLHRQIRRQHFQQRERR